MKIKEGIENNKLLKNTWIRSLLANLIILVLFLVVMHPYLENEADIIMRDLTSGDYGEGIPTNSILFSNYIIGSAIIGLRTVMSGIPWYMVIHTLLSYAALVIIGGLCFKKFLNYAGRWITVGILAYAGFECYVTPGYLKTAAILAVTSAFLLFELMERNDSLGTKGKMKYIIMAACAGLLSSLFAFFVFVAIFVACAILSGIYLLLFNINEKKKLTLKTAFLGVIITMGILIVAAGLYYMDRRHYFSDPALSASIAYRLGYEKCLSYGVPYFEVRDDNLVAVHDAIYRLGALDPEMVDINERLMYMGQTKLTLTGFEVINFARFEPENISHLPFIYLWGFLAYMLARYGGRTGRRLVVSSLIIGVVTLFIMRQYFLLGYYRMYTIEILPFIYLFILGLDLVRYEPPVEPDENKRRALLAVDVALVIYLAFFLFGDEFPIKKDMVHETKMLYVEDDGNLQVDDGGITS